VDSSYTVNETKALAKVGSRSPKGDGKWNQADLIGNIAEWVLDYAGDYPTPCYNCVNHVASERRVLRGGDYRLPAVQNDGSKYQVLPDAREGGYGARCTRP
jgi:formylglycine-generating enzyme required for sulfatase activity